MNSWISCSISSSSRAEFIYTSGEFIYCSSFLQILKNTLRSAFSVMTNRYVSFPNGIFFNSRLIASISFFAA